MTQESWKSELRRRANEIVARQVGADAVAPGGAASRRREVEVHDIEMELEDDLVRQLQHRELELRLQLQQMSERQRELEELHLREKERCRDLFDASPMALLDLTPDGRILEANAAALSLFGAGQNGLAGQRLESFVADEDQTLFDRHRRRLRKRESDGCTLRIRGADGSRVVQLQSICRRAGAMRWRATLVDLTQQQKLERMLQSAQRYEAATLLASALAHDINNLLMGISGCIEYALLVLEGDNPARGALERVQGAVVSGAELVCELSRFKSRHAGGGEVVDLGSMVKRSRTMLERLVGEDVRVEVTLTREDARIQCHPVEVEQVLLNLAINARAAMPRGGSLSIATSVEPIDEERARALGIEPSDYVVLTVRDSGCGMNEATLARALEPYFTTKGPSEGSGLGLSTIQSIASNAKGVVQLRSRPGQGTTVRVLFPQTDAPASTRPIAVTPPSHERKATVLLVDDAVMARQAMRHLLERAGHEVLTAGSVAEAVSLCRRLSGKIDLAVLDVVLPDGNGDRVGRRIAEAAPDAAIIYTTAHPPDELTRRGILSNGAFTLHKPITEMALRSAVADALTRLPSPARPVDFGSQLLVVESDRLQRDALARLLADEGFEVVTAGDGHGALSVVRATVRPFGLAMVDQHLPDMDGGLAARALRSVQAGLPVIFSAAMAPTHEMETELTHPRTAWVEKPIAVEPLAQLIQMMLEPTGAARAARRISGNLAWG